MNRSIVSLLAIGLSVVEAIQFGLQLEAHPRPNRGLAARQTGLEGESEVESIDTGRDFITSVQIGNQVLRLLVDTGSSDLWALSTQLPQDVMQQLEHNNFFDPNSSPSFQSIPGATYNVSYDSGEIGTSGIVGTDVVTVGGIELPGMPFGLANNIVGLNLRAVDSTHDGIMGLGWPATQNMIAVDGQPAPGPTFMTAVQSYLDEPVFTADFRPDHPKTLAFGFVNPSLYTGNLSTVPIDNSLGYWGIDSVTFSSGSKSLGSSTGISMIMDTGGVAQTVDNQTAIDYWQLVQGSTYQASSNKFMFPCNTPSLPDFTWNFPNGNTATMPGNILNLTADPSSQNDGLCYGGLQPTGNGNANCGSTFFNIYFTVWNQAEATFSYAPYSGTDDNAGTNYANLPAASNDNPEVTLSVVPPSATIKATSSLKATATPTISSSSTTTITSTSTHHNAAIPTKAPIAGIGAGAALIAGLALL